MSLSRVSPGEPLRPKFTAEWYNHTIQPHNPSSQKRGGKHFHRVLREGELYCLAEDSTTERFNPVFITGYANTDIDGPRIPTIASTPEDEHDWVIPQSDMKEDGLILTVVSGLTKAWVQTRSVDDKCVVYNPSKQVLETAKEGKAQMLVRGDSQFPSLINIGVQSQVIRIVGTLSGALIGTPSFASIGNLRGVNFFANALGASISALNIHEFEADAGAVVRAEWVMEPGRWEIYQVTCPS